MRYLFLLLLIVTGCTSGPQEAVGFSAIECSKTEMPQYDARKVSLLDTNGVAYKDTLISQIEKRRTVFKPCRSYTYQADYYDSEDELITSSRIRMTANGQRWRFQPESQDEIVIQYEYTDQDFKTALKYKLNKSMPSLVWQREVTTGVIENVGTVWMHPFRSNQYLFTEVAPFPEVQFPLEIGKAWSSQLNIQQGWGDWENTTGNNSYKITGQETIETKYGQIKDCWKIESTASYPFGESDFDYWFSEELGFVKMAYQNYGDQSLQIELVEIDDL
ncbi:MAG: hypothetical protein AAF242_02100 [Bacteroidota bacterium]